jgi:hypothetical protein
MQAFVNGFCERQFKDGYRNGFMNAHLSGFTFMRALVVQKSINEQTELCLARQEQIKDNILLKYSNNNEYRTNLK